MSETKHFYGMRTRGCAPGCQPAEGFVERIDSNIVDYYDIISYNRKLSEAEEKTYSLDELKQTENGFELIVRIKEQVSIIQKKPIMLNGIRFRLRGVNASEFDLYDVDEKTSYSGDPTDGKSFTERLELAKVELELETEGMSLEDAQEHFKRHTEKDNAYYWGTMCFVPTLKMPKGFIEFGVRMD